MKISDEILGILSRCTVDGNTLYLPDEQLDRKTYTAVNKCLVNIGGKWNRKAKGHVFDHDPSDDLDSMLLTGETVDMKKVYQFFPTPKKLRSKCVEWLNWITIVLCWSLLVVVVIWQMKFMLLV